MKLIELLEPLKEKECQKGQSACVFIPQMVSCLRLDGLIILRLLLSNIFFFSFELMLD